MVKLEVDASINEINALDDLAVCWILCDKHKEKTAGIKDEVEIFRIQQNCKECAKLIRKNSLKVMNLWSKMIHAYNIARYGKCDCKERTATG